MAAGRLPGTVNYIRSAATSNESSARHLRHQDEEIDVLASELNNWRANGTGTFCKIETSIKMMALFLEYGSSGGFFRQVGKSHGSRVYST